ncbi:hypothetical protein BJY04DRAFT_37526 [Aspergillus karnatakaensis]|uniref:uncharacterized protein n=1 Tax=Aspergillus karnatakaensis TaxID=1810916 RepID=UPI003CCE2FC6
MASASDSTPLLADSEPLEAGEYTIPQDRNVTKSLLEKPPFHRTTVVLTHLSAALSIFALVFDLTVILTDAANPHGFYIFWTLLGLVQGLFGISILSTIASSLNLIRLRHARAPLWLWLNLIFDAVIVALTVKWGPEAIARNFDQNPDTWLPDTGAANAARAVIVLLGIGLSAGLIVGLVHLILIPLRCYASFQSGANWRVPGGEFKIDFSVRFLRQEEAVPARRDSGEA